MFRTRYGSPLVTELKCLAPSSTLLAVSVHNAGFLAQSIGVAYCITLDKRYTGLPD